MAKERMINTRIWSDNWVSQLDPIEKLLFLYFLTNSYTNISGIYELPLKVAAVETGIDISMFHKILPRLEDKVIYREGWVILPNFPRYQNLKSKDVVLGIQREFDSVPNRIKSEAVGGGWGEGLGIAPDTKPNLTKPLVAKATEISEVPEDSDPEPKRKKKVSAEMQAVFDLFKDNPARLQWRLYESERAAAGILAKEFSIEELQHRYKVAAKYREEELCPKIYTPSQFLEKMPNMESYLKNHHA